MELVISHSGYPTLYICAAPATKNAQCGLLVVERLKAPPNENFAVYGHFTHPPPKKFRPFICEINYWGWVGEKEIQLEKYPFPARFVCGKRL